VTHRRVEIEWLSIDVQNQLMAFESPAGELGKQMAAAAVLRCHSCLDGITTLLAAGLRDMTGLLVRQAWECWLVGIYLALGGPSAMREVVGDYARALRVQGERWAGHPGVPEELASVAEARIPVEVMAQRVGDLLRRLDPPSPLVDANSHYNVLYRTESSSGVHAGAGLLLRYLEDTDKGVRLKWSPESAVVDDDVEEMVAAYLAHLASVVFPVIGLDGKRVARLFELLVDESD
jgi:hypothetical protein